MTWRDRGVWWAEQYLRNLLYCLDLSINCVFLFGDPKETISSRMAKRARDGRRLSRLGCRFLDLFDPGHCIRVLRPGLGQDQIWGSPWKSVAAGATVVGLLAALLVWRC